MFLALSLIDHFTVVGLVTLPLNDSEAGGDLGYLPFTWENRKFQLEDQLVRAIPFGKPQKIWVMVCDDAIFLLF